MAGRLFACKVIELSKEELNSVKAADLSPAAREILRNSGFPLLEALVGEDQKKADEAARKLTRENFKISCR